MNKTKKIIVSVLIVISGIAYLAYQKNEKNQNDIAVKIIEKQMKEPIIAIDAYEDLENLLINKKTPYIIFCHMDNCYWCEQMAPVIDDVANHPDFESIQFYTINSKLLENSDIMHRVIGKEIEGFPISICMDQGKCIQIIDGYTDQEEFTKAITSNFTKL